MYQFTYKQNKLQIFYNSPLWKLGDSKVGNPWKNDEFLIHY